MFAKQRKTDWALLIFTFIWIVSSCAYQHAPSRPDPEIPPAPAEIKLEPLVSEPDVTDINIPESTEPKPSVYLHTVHWPRETLSHIAKWYTGTIKNWKTIAKANSDLDPKKIDAGDTILIPEDLLITRTPMPRSFLGSADRKKTDSISSSHKISAPSKSPELYGPIETRPSSTASDAVKLFGPME